MGEDFEEDIIILKAKIADLKLEDASESKIKDLEKELEKLNDKMCAAVAKEMNVNWLKYDKYFAPHNSQYINVPDGYELILIPILFMISYIAAIIFIATTAFYIISGRKKIFYRMLYWAMFSLYLVLGLLFAVYLKISVTYIISLIFSFIAIVLSIYYVRKIMGITRKKNARR